MTVKLARQGKKLFIEKHKSEQIIQKNRDLRVQIKSLIKDNGVRGSAESQKNRETKRALIKQKNVIMEENDGLLFKFKKLFLF